MEPDSPEIYELFNDAQEIPDPVERAAYLERACAGNDSLRTRIEELLRAAEHAQVIFPEQTRSGSSFASAAGSSGPGSSESDQPCFKTGTLIGRYEVIRQIGRGGFGEVYLAVQKEPVFRNVALKVIRKGRNNQQILRRFESELQALTLMDHPNIAKLHDAGAMEDGTPFFVMELVSGLSITAYCRKHELHLRPVLQLFQQVCRAVQHAHMKGIIHRDLKPANILVTEVDGRPVCKVIDFGVAKALDTSLMEVDSLTESFQIIGTLFYMAPEQAAADRPAIDVRADVYSLGTVLYELLTGLTPVTRKELGNASLLQALRTIQEKDPPRPSFRLQAMRDGTSELTSPVKTEVRTLYREVQGDIDWIIMKAIEKDRGRRYQSVSEFRQDIESYLGDRTVNARPPSAWYTMRKFARRHQARVLATSVTVVVLTIALTIGHFQRLQQRADNLADRLLAARPEAVGLELAELSPLLRRAEPLLRSALTNRTSIEQFRARLALLPLDPGQLGPLLDQLPELALAEIASALDHLPENSAPVTGWARLLASDGSVAAGSRLRAAVVLARFAPAEPAWTGLGAEVARWLVREVPLESLAWAEQLEPVAEQLLPELRVIFADGAGPLHPAAAAGILAHFLRGDATALIDLVETASPDQLKPLLEALAPGASTVIPELNTRFAAALPPEADQETRDARYRLQVRLGAALLTLGGGDPVWNVFAELTPADPTLRTHLIHGLAEYRTPPRVLLNRLATQSSPAIRQAILSALGGYDVVDLPQIVREQLRSTLAGYLRSETVAGTRSMAEWLLRHWGMEGEIATAAAELASLEPPPAQNWYVTPSGFAMTVFRDLPVFELGNNATTNLWYPNPRHWTRIDRDFAIATSTLSWLDVDAFLLSRSSAEEVTRRRKDRAANSPDLGINKPEAMRYCNWLSQRDGFPESEWCYTDPGGTNDPVAVENHLARRGYRLPTEAEWEYSVRGGAATESSFGMSIDHLDWYLWYDLNSRGSAKPAGLLRPNVFGLFDGQGNAYQWCDDAFRELPSDTSAANPLVDRSEPVTADTIKDAFRGSDSSARMEFINVSTRHFWYRSSRTIYYTTIRIARTISDL